MKMLITSLGFPEVLVLVGAVVAAVGALLVTARQNVFEGELRRKSDEIASLNRRIADLVTGGESYIMLEMFPGIQGGNTATVFAVHHGDHPVYDISVTIIDSTKRRARFDEELSRRGVVSLQSVFEDQATFALGTMVKNLGRPLPPLALPERSDVQRYSVNVFARNGLVTGDFVFRRVAGKWLLAQRLMREGKVLEERIPQDFPREPDGAVKWEQEAATSQPRAIEKGKEH